MSRKALFFAAASLMAAMSGLAPAHAGPSSARYAWQGYAPSDTAGGYYGQADYDRRYYDRRYYSHGYYDDRYRPYDGPSLLDLPPALLGGAFGIVTGAIDGALNGSLFFDRPSYSDRHYGSDYYGDGYYRGRSSGASDYDELYDRSEYYDNDYYGSNYSYTGGYYSEGYYGGR